MHSQELRARRSELFVRCGKTADVIGALTHGLLRAEPRPGADGGAVNQPAASVTVYTHAEVRAMGAGRYHARVVIFSGLGNRI